MSDETLNSLIAELPSYWNTFLFPIEFTRGEKTDNSGAYWDFLGPTKLGRICVWDSGDIDLLIADISSEEHIFAECSNLKNSKAIAENFIFQFVNIVGK